MIARQYRTLTFDCDGVVLDSNRIKTLAFAHAAAPYGAEAAEALVAHHVANGGISRFAKFRHFLDEIVATPGDGPDIDALLDAYAEAVKQGLRNCAIAPGLHALREATPDTRWLIVSGGAQDELRDVFAERGLSSLFDGGIFGSPDTKDDILAREIAAGNISQPALFIGDSTYDYRAASGANLDFVFASYWTEVADWPSFVAANNLHSVDSLRELTAAIS